MAQPRKSPGRPRNLLIELGTEELPPRALKSLAEAFAGSLFASLVEAGVAADKPGHMRWYATPRRLAVWVKGVLPRQPDTVEERRGPSVQAAFDAEGNPTPAADGFARSCGVPVAKLKRRESDKGAWLVHENRVRGRVLNAVITECLASSVRALPIPRRMRWGSNTAEFVRPVHWLVALYGSDQVRTEVLGLKANRLTRGHRFHAPGELKILSADRYLNTLKTSGFVVADYEARQTAIHRQATRLAKKDGGNAVIDPMMLDEVTGLVEWPVALLGHFENRFLRLPKEVLVSTMEKHQKYFPVSDAKGKLLPAFVAVSNIKSKSPKRVREGNERVLRARLSDAEFFWNSDQQVRLDDRVTALQGVLFHNRLGTVRDKAQRVEKLAVRIAGLLEADAGSVRRAALLCKTDLVTDMVGEFPELQGVIGKYYAAQQGEDRRVASAIDEHYLPRFAGDDLPSGKISQCLALADRIDTLAGIFACGEVPTGDKDPFALRRAALGVLRILVEKKIRLDLGKLVREGLKPFSAGNFDGLDAGDETATAILSFFNDRLKGYLQGRGYSIAEINAVQAVGSPDPHDLHRRVKSLNRFVQKRLAAAESLAASNKRIANILSKSQVDASAGKHLSKLLKDEAEIELAKKVKSLGPEVRKLLAEGQYDKAFKKLSALKKPVDKFFDEVMVMDKNEEIRNNRLALLAEIRNLFLGVADISRLQVG